MLNINMTIFGDSQTTISNEAVFVQDCLVILKRMLQNYQKVVNTYEYQYGRCHNMSLYTNGLKTTNKK